MWKFNINKDYFFLSLNSIFRAKKKFIFVEFEKNKKKAYFQKKKIFYNYLPKIL